MAKVDAKGRVTLPKELRERLDIAPGTSVEIRAEGDRVVVEPERDPEAIVSELETAVEDLERTGRVDDDPDPVADRHRERIRRGANRGE